MTDNELMDLIESESQEVVDLVEVHDRVVELRDAYLRKNELEHQLKLMNHQITKIERDELPDLFNKARISNITVQPTGNHPGFDAELTTVYTAKIPDEKRMEAFEWMESYGVGDLIKSHIDIVFGMQEHEKRLKVMKLLSDNGVEFYTNESVHHQTLKAFVRRELRAGHVIPMDLLGAYIFDEVKIKQGK